MSDNSLGLPGRTVVSVSARKQVLHVLAANSQYLPAAAHVHDLLTDGEVDHKDAVALFNSILMGIYHSGARTDGKSFRSSSKEDGGVGCQAQLRNLASTGGM